MGAFKVQDYMDIPFVPHGRDRRGVDCWGLVRLIYRDHKNIDLPSFAGAAHNISDPSEVSPLFESGRDDLWQRVSAPQMFDVIGWRAARLIYHVGIYLEDNMFLHIQKGTESTVSRIGTVLWPERRVAGYFRVKI